MLRNLNVFIPKLMLTDPGEYEDFDEEDFDEEGIEDPSQLEEGFSKETKLGILLADQGKGLLESLGHQFSDLVMKCTFRGVSCRFDKLEILPTEFDKCVPITVGAYYSVVSLACGNILPVFS